jgi:hypothetical protein
MIGDSTFAQTVAVPKLPVGSMILETKVLPAPAKQQRALVLWMEHAEKHPRGLEPLPEGEKPEAYTCPDETRGSFYRGPTRASLINTAAYSVINTVEIKVPLIRGWRDEFDIPYWIRPTHYRVDPPLRAGEGKPVILDLKDYNGDGQALEFGIFDAQSCAVVETQLVGYSVRQDRVIQFPIHLKGDWHNAVDPTLLWLDRLLLKKPVAPRFWKYSIFYNSGDTGSFEIRYDYATESFVGKVNWRSE